MSNPYAPQEPPSQIYSEETWLQGALLSSIIYGIELTLAAICFARLMNNSSTDSSHRRQQHYLTACVAVLFTLGTFFMGSLSKFTQLAFIENRIYPSGPAAYEKAMFWIPVDELGNVSFVIGSWLMDALLVWRCSVFYKGCSNLYWPVMAFTCLLLAASFALGVVFLVQTSTSSPFSAVNFTLAYFVATLALNIIVTILIVARLIYLRRHAITLRSTQHTSYASVAAILVESASLYSVFSILFLVPFGLGNALSQVFLQTLSQVQTVSSLLIILRLAEGKAWKDETTKRVSTSLTRVGEVSANDTGTQAVYATSDGQESKNASDLSLTSKSKAKGIIEDV